MHRLKKKEQLRIYAVNMIAYSFRMRKHRRIVTEKIRKARGYTADE
jgi:hypothetical protein